MSSLYHVYINTLSDIYFSKYFPILQVPFHFIGHFFCCAEVFELDTAPPVELCTGSLYYWCHIPKLVSKTLVHELFLLF